MWILVREMSESVAADWGMLRNVADPVRRVCRCVPPSGASTLPPGGPDGHHSLSDPGVLKLSALSLF